MASPWMCPAERCTGRIWTRIRSSGPTWTAAASKTSSQDWSSHMASRWMCRRKDVLDEFAGE